MIPLSVPNISGNEIKYVKECLETGWISTAGKFVTKFENSFSDKIGVKESVSTMNGTSALHLALLKTVKQDTYVIMPNITFVASANAVAYTGAIPLFLDVNEDDWQLDLDILENFLEEDCFQKNQTTFYKKKKIEISAIMIVHIQGNICDMERLLKIAKKFNLTIIEDAAEALGSKYKGKYAGTLGNYGCFSFNGNKIISTGGGGMVVAKSKKNISSIRHLATTAKTDPLRYYHDEVAYNYRLVNVLAAIGLAQLEQLDKFVIRKQEISEIYRNELKNVGDISFQKVRKDTSPNEWLFTIRTEKMEKLLSYLNNKDIMSRPFWAPMTELPMYKKNIFISKNNISNRLHKTGLSLPCSTGISDDDLSLVVKCVKSFFK